MVCAACMWSRAWGGLPCPQHRDLPPAAPAQSMLPHDRDDLVDGGARRPWHRLSEGEARQLLLDDLDRYGESHVSDLPPSPSDPSGADSVGHDAVDV